MDDDLESFSQQQLIEEVKKLRQAIREHRDCSGHDLCWHHPHLWSLLPEAIPPTIAVPEWPQFMRGCIRYRQSLDEQAADAPRRGEEFMPAYLYASEEITDPAAHAEYRRQVPAILAAHGGRFLVRGGAVDLLEGDVPPERVVIVEFPTMAQLKAFYDSPEYQSILSIRQRSAKSYLLAIEGL